MLALNVEKQYQEFSLNICEKIPLSGITAIFGSSGAGKTTLLRLIAGHDTPDQGQLSFNEETIFNTSKKIIIPTYQRGFGFLTQNTNLFPHLSVTGNLDFAEKRSLSVQGSSGQYDRASIIDTFAIGNLLTRKINHLSGGERQRVSLARTLLSRPRLLLLDEPLTGMDHLQKQAILPFLQKLSTDFGLPVIFVSHHIDEVYSLADRILMLENGQKKAFGPTVSILNNQNIVPSISPLEEAVWYEVTALQHDHNLRISELGLITTPDHKTSINIPINEKLSRGTRSRVRILARDVTLAIKKPEGISIQNILEGTIADIQTNSSPFVTVSVSLADDHNRLPPLKACITHAALKDLGLTKNMKVFALVKSIILDDHLTLTIKNN